MDVNEETTVKKIFQRLGRVILRIGFRVALVISDNYLFVLDEKLKTSFLGARVPNPVADAV